MFQLPLLCIITMHKFRRRSLLFIFLEGRSVGGPDPGFSTSINWRLSCQPVSWISDGVWYATGRAEDHRELTWFSGTLKAMKRVPGTRSPIGLYFSHLQLVQKVTWKNDQHKQHGFLWDILLNCTHLSGMSLTILSVRQTFYRNLKIKFRSSSKLLTMFCKEIILIPVLPDYFKRLLNICCWVDTVS